MKFRSVSLPRTPEGITRVLLDNNGKFVDAQVDDGLISIIGTLAYKDSKTYRIFEEGGLNSLYKVDELKRLAIRID